jgi:ribosome maturation factor RimP
MAEAREIARHVEPLLAALGLDLYDVEIGSGRAPVVRVLVDREGGVDLDTIARASEAIVPVLARGPLAGARGPFSLEVSSPGLERPLRRPEHFERAVGSTVSVKARVDAAPARRVRGVLVTAGDESFEVMVEGDGAEHFAYADVVQARTVFEWGSTPERAARRKGARGRKPIEEEAARR